jgi:hypothetical protein
VVWEGRRREASPYPDQRRILVVQAPTVFIPAFCPSHRALPACRKWFTQNVCAKIFLGPVLTKEYTEGDH